MSAKDIADARRDRAIEAVASLIKEPWAWPGGYPRYALTADGGVLCAACVKRERSLVESAIRDNDQTGGWLVEAVDVWEGGDEENDTLRCDHCGSDI